MFIPKEEAMYANHTEATEPTIDHFDRVPKGAKKPACTVRQCNLCNEKFLALSRFERFCATCKKENELYQYHETLPTVSEELL